MRIVALLSWYDEPTDWLRECVRSAALFCDHLIAVDGAYADFPGGREKPTSPPAQAEAILVASGDMGCTLHRRPTPWGGEVAKRNHLFRLAEAEGADWAFRIDADEVVTDVPGDLREQLARTSQHVGTATFMFEATPGWPLTPSQLRVLFRVLPGIGVSGAHSRVVVALDGRRVSLAGPDLGRCEPAETVEGLRMLHRTHERTPERQARKSDYYQLLPALEH